MEANSQAHFQFEWDEDKAQSNARDHRVTFDEAVTVFRDALASAILDPDHSLGEERYLTIGLSTQGRLLVVSYTERRANCASLGVSQNNLFICISNRLLSVPCRTQ